MGFPYYQLIVLGLSLGAGVGLATCPFIVAFAVWDAWSERRSKERRASRRRPPSILADTEELPAVGEGAIIRWGGEDDGRAS